MDEAKIEVEVYDVIADDNVIDIYWSGNIGFGVYTLYIKDGAIKADSEYMDDNNDKWFLKKLFEKIVEKVEVEF